MKDLYTRLREYEPFADLGYDISNAQRIAVTNFQQHKILGNNPILSNAINGNESITDKLEDLSKINKGIRIFLPRRINPEHNEQIETIGTLISHPRYLKTKGISSLDNFVSFFFLTTSIGFLIPNVLGIKDIKDFNFYEYVFNFYEYVLVTSFFGGLFTNFLSRILPSYLSDSKSEAEYLDQKIEELHIKEENNEKQKL